MNLITQRFKGWEIAPLITGLRPDKGIFHCKGVGGRPHENFDFQRLSHSSKAYRALFVPQYTTSS